MQQFFLSEQLLSPDQLPYPSVCDINKKRPNPDGESVYVLEQPITRYQKGIAMDDESVFGKEAFQYQLMQRNNKYRPLSILTFEEAVLGIPPSLKHSNHQTSLGWPLSLFCDLPGKKDVFHFDEDGELQCGPLWSLMEQQSDEILSQLLQGHVVPIVETVCPLS